jgi:hypothetical protein
MGADTFKTVSGVLFVEKHISDALLYQDQRYLNE